MGSKRRKTDAKAKETIEKAEYITNIQDTIYACKTFRSVGSGETTHFTDATTNEVNHCVAKMHEWIMNSWMLLFRMYEFQPEPVWEAFRAEYENEFRGWTEECPQQIHETMIEI